jgi:hypothetical protein
MDLYAAANAGHIAVNSRFRFQDNPPANGEDIAPYRPVDPAAAADDHHIIHHPAIDLGIAADNDNRSVQEHLLRDVDRCPKADQISPVMLDGRPRRQWGQQT